MASSKRIGRERGVSLFLGTLSLIFIVPLIGLVIDVGILYSAKSRLQAAVDGAALAAARALNVGQTLTAQTNSAKQNAVNWFYANFPAGTWSTTNTQMDTTDTHVSVTSPANIRTVAVSATTTVPTWFMRWFNINSTNLTATGTASRRDVNMMMVLDRSYSMVISGSCANLVSAAKIFTGQFAAGRDRLGLISFGGDVVVQSAPTTSFQTTLGYYIDATHNGTGAIDNILCNGNTNTSQAISLAYNELWKQNLPGALNVILLETDGLPNTATVNFYDGTAFPNSVGLTGGSCTDTAGTTQSGGGFGSTAKFKNWTTQVPLCGLGGGPACGTNNSYLSGNPQLTPSGAGGTGYTAGLVGAVGSTDPGDLGGSTESFIILQQPYSGNVQPLDPATYNFDAPGATSGTAPGCSFDATAQNNGIWQAVFPGTTASDFAWFPASDVYGNSLRPATNPFINVTMNGSHVANTGWTNWHNAAQNAADNAAYNARVGVSFPSPNNGTNLSVLIDVIGLGSPAATGITPPNYILMQRIANDPNGDNFSGSNLYSACASEGSSASNNGCITYSSQPQGTFVFSTDKNDLNRAFLQISSQVLRLSK